MQVQNQDNTKQKSKTPESISQGKYRILVAEDNAVNRKLAYYILHNHGHQVTMVENGKEAVRTWEEQMFDLILMDIQMPKMDGFQATSLIREKEKNSGHHIPIIAITAHAMKGDSEKCIQGGMDEYISKPIKADRLLSLIDRLVQKPKINTEETAQEKSKTKNEGYNDHNLNR
jgi:CheY-like chemotaxis protein